MIEQPKYRVGQMLRIREGVYGGNTFALVDEDDIRMSSGVTPIPEYYYEHQARWYFEDEVELVA